MYNSNNFGHHDSEADNIKSSSYQCISVYPKVKQDSTYKIIETVSSLVPIDKVNIFEDNIEVIRLTFCNNYDEIPKTIELDEYNKVYTMNKGYISAGNLGGQDVLFDGEGRIRKIISKEKVKICDMTDGHVFKVVRMLEKYNANIPTLMQERFDDLHKTHPEYFL